VAKAPSGHFTTGIFGTKYILEALSFLGNIDQVYNIVNSTGFPGWGYMIDRGATTIWETWKESDNVYSNCHPMFGTVSEWMYRWLAGIRPDPENPGFKKFIMAPNIPKGLEYVNCVYHSPFGKIVSNWKNLKGNQEYEITIPDGSSALVRLPVNEQQKITLAKKMGDNLFSQQGEYKGHVSFELNAGEYKITVR
jgi:alpha-L-rhamnosidase